MDTKLFVYGTLRKEEVQKKVAGRVLESTPDTLVGFEKKKVEINGNIYPILVKKEDSKLQIQGEVLHIKEEDFKALDEYETDAYRREEIVLKSGVLAWVYQE